MSGGFPPIREIAEACAVCGGREFRHTQVIWQALAEEWELTPAAVDYIDRQQGTVCRGCGSNLRSIALAKALVASYGATARLVDFAPALDPGIRILEINPAGTLTSWLSGVPGHELIEYPAYDMESLALEPGLYDRVVHSDTLEHIADPVTALKECLRVLKPGGAVCFTVPIVVERLTRSRGGLPPSYHGAPGQASPDLLVHSEFGADIWVLPFLAAFERVEFTRFAPPAGFAITAWKGGSAASGGRPLRSGGSAISVPPTGKAD